MWVYLKLLCPLCIRSSPVWYLSQKCCYILPEGDVDGQRWIQCGLVQGAIWTAQSGRCPSVVAIFDGRETGLSLFFGGETTCSHVHLLLTLCTKYPIQVSFFFLNGKIWSVIGKIITCSQLFQNGSMSTSCLYINPWVMTYILHITYTIYSNWAISPDWVFFFLYFNRHTFALHYLVFSVLSVLLPVKHLKTSSTTAEDNI